MDGNGRWAKQRNQPRTFGHYYGVQAMKKTINACLQLNIPCVSFYAFSTENWDRPASEVKYLMKLLMDNLLGKKTVNWFMEQQVRFIWNGQVKHLDDKMLEGIKELMQLTKNNSKMTVQIMFNYSGCLEIIDAAAKLAEQHLAWTEDNFNQAINPYHLPNLDLLIRTSGECRISNFMLWQLSYAEIIFNPIYWPDYDENALQQDLNEFQQRHRRFGRV